MSRETSSLSAKEAVHVKNDDLQLNKVAGCSNIRADIDLLGVTFESQQGFDDYAINQLEKSHLRATVEKKRRCECVRSTTL